MFHDVRRPNSDTEAGWSADRPAWQREDVADQLDARHTLASILADEDLPGETDFAVAWNKALSVTDVPVR